MKLTVKDTQGKSLNELEVKFSLIEDGRGTQAVHDVIVAYNANQRSGTACTKTAGDVNGTNRKPWRQKGTGRARAGSFASPLWRGGGVVFGPKPRDFGRQIPQATRALAFRKALSERMKAGDVIVVDDLKLGSAKTKEIKQVLAALQLDGTTLLVVPGVDKNLGLATRNLAKTEVTTGTELNTYQVLRFDKLVFTRGGLEQVEQRLA